MCVGHIKQVRVVGAGSYSSVFADEDNAYKVLGRALGENTQTVLREGLLLKLGYGVGLSGILTDYDGHITGFALTRGICSLSGWHVKRPIDVMQLQLWCHDILNNMASLHASNIIHGDIKPQNMIVFKNGSAALCDFGLSSLITDVPGGTTSSNDMFTLLYRPPELFYGGPWTVSKSLDIWAFGVSLFQLLFARTPFYENRKADEMIAFLDVNVPRDYAKRIAKFTMNLRTCCCPEAEVFAEIMAKSLDRDDRPSAWALLQLLKKPDKAQLIALDSLLPVQPLQPFQHEIVDPDLKFTGEVKPINRQLCLNVAKLVLLPQECLESYVIACSSLYNILHKQCGEATGVRAVAACAIAMYIYKTSDCLRIEWLSKMAGTSTAIMNSQIEKCLVPAIQDPSWCEGIWCSFSAPLGPTYV